MNQDILKKKTKEYIERNHTDNPYEEMEWLWYVIENNLTELEQEMLIYRLFFYDTEEQDKVSELFNLSVKQYHGKITSIKNKIKKICEQ